MSIISTKYSIIFLNKIHFSTIIINESSNKNLHDKAYKTVRMKGFFYWKNHFIIDEKIKCSIEIQINETNYIHMFSYKLSNFNNMFSISI